MTRLSKKQEYIISELWILAWNISIHTGLYNDRRTASWITAIGADLQEVVNLLEASRGRGARAAGLRLFMAEIDFSRF
jgi:hypothetical protein